MECGKVMFLPGIQSGNEMLPAGSVSKGLKSQNSEIIKKERFALFLQAPLHGGPRF